MGSTFSSLNAGLTGLYAAQRLIEVSGQNINNQNTAGYVRQRVEQKALGIGSDPSIFAGSVPQGGGVEITRIRRIDDFFLDTKLRLETGRSAQAKEISSAWAGIESSMDELGKMSLSNSLRDFYKSWADVNNSSDNRGARATAIGNAEALVTQIKTGYIHINDLWKNGREQLDALVSDLNTTMDSVMELNDRIRKATAAGGEKSGAVNHLKDERDVLVLHLAKLTGATVKPGYSVYTKENAPNQSLIGTAYEDGTVEVMLAGNSMVGKNFVNHFVVSGTREMAGVETAPREKYRESVEALEGTVVGGRHLSTDTKFTFHGQSIQKYQSQVRIYEVGDTLQDGTRITLGTDSEKYIGRKYVAFYDMEAVQRSGKSLNEAKVSGTDRDFVLSSFYKDEGPVRLTWQTGGHLVATEEGTIGGLMNNLKPAQVPGVSGTIGNGGSWAETGKLYNDMATNIAKEVNQIHANNLEEISTSFVDAGGNPVGTPIQRVDYASREEYDKAVADYLQRNPTHVAKPSLTQEENNTKTLVTEKATFQAIHLDEPETIEDPANRGTFIPNPARVTKLQDEIRRSDYANDELYDAAVKAKQTELEKANPNCAIVFENVKKDGGDFFKFAATDNTLPPALRIQVAVKDPQELAAGKYHNGVYDGSVSMRLNNQQDAATSTLNEWAKSVVDIGVHAKGSKDNFTLTEQTRRIAEQEQKSQSSVDMNEEVVNLIQGQHAYAGAARIMSTVNSMLETLLNMGR